MLFWRAKTAKQISNQTTVESTAAPAADGPASTTANADAEADADVGEGNSIQNDDAGSPSAKNDSKIVSLSSVRLAERLADISVPVLAADENLESSEPDAVTIEPTKMAATTIVARENPSRGSKASAASALRLCIEAATDNGHVLVVGPVGTGRRAAALSIANDIAAQRAAPSDWVYAATAASPGTLSAYAVPNGAGARMVRDVQDALAKSAAMLTRLMASDGHQMSLAALEEEHRQRSDGGIEQLKRRAEAQNIALVKTSEGFVLAPMHEGRVVRSDVFRALPDALQRDVEAKIAVLESELQELLGALPGSDIATDDRHLALSHQTAERAVKPNLSVARKLFSGAETVPGTIKVVIDAIETDWTRRAAHAVRHNAMDALIQWPGLQAMGSDASDRAPVVLAHSVRAIDLLGEIGRDAAGRVAVRPGHLARANGGFLIVDAWRLAADPSAWAALSSALETSTWQPIASSGLAVTAEPIPLNITLIVIAERRTLARLKAVDPRFEKYFSDCVTFDAAPALASVQGRSS